MTIVDMAVYGTAFVLSCFIVHRLFFHDKWASLANKLERRDPYNGVPQKYSPPKYIREIPFDERITRTLPAIE